MVRFFLTFLLTCLTERGQILFTATPSIGGVVFLGTITYYPLPRFRLDWNRKFSKMKLVLMKFFE